MTLKQQQEALKQEIKNIKALLNGSVDQCELACQLLIGHEILADSKKQELLKGFQKDFHEFSKVFEQRALDNHDNKNICKRFENQFIEYNDKTQTIIKARIQLLES